MCSSPLLSATVHCGMQGVESVKKNLIWADVRYIVVWPLFSRWRSASAVTMMMMLEVDAACRARPQDLVVLVCPRLFLAIFDQLCNLMVLLNRFVTWFAGKGEE